MDKEGIRIVKAVLLSILVLLAAVSPAAAQKAAPQIRASGVFDGLTVFRNIMLGVSKDDVRKFERAALYKEEAGSLYYVYKPDGFRRVIRYDFENDKLVRIHHSVAELHFPNSSRVIDMYYDVQSRMIALYGDPAGIELFWKNKKYEQHPAYWGRALYSEDLRLASVWTPPGVVIRLNCYRAAHAYHLYYTFEPARQEEAQRNAIDLRLPAAQP